MDKYTTLFSLVKDASVNADTNSNPRHIGSVMMKLMSEVGELATEIDIEMGCSYKKPDVDGVVGEALDVILAALDVIHLHDPTISEKDLITRATVKTNKWLTLSKKEN